MAKPLQDYQRKRDFAATPEPSGQRTRHARGGGLRFCIQKHDASHLHYDFRLELDGVLKSWAVPKGPSLDPSVKRLAVEVEDHPLAYADFEGHIPEGHYGAGDVVVWDKGLWEPEGDAAQGYAEGKLRFRLQGEKLGGSWHLFRTRMAGKRTQWMLVKSKDDAARDEGEFSVTDALPDSVLSDLTIKSQKTHKAKARNAAASTTAAKRKSRSKSGTPALPDQLTPQLATLVDAAPAGDWRYEVKFDGYRILARVEGDDVRLLTRNGHDWRARMPRLATALQTIGVDSAWFDGEVVVANDHGVSDFQALQNAFDDARDEDLQYYVFDLLYLSGADLRQQPLHARREALRELLAAVDTPCVRFSEDFDAPAGQLLESACQLGLEGVIGKRADSRYSGRRSRDWIKLKCVKRQEFVVLGYTDPKGSRSGFGALLLGLHGGEDQGLQYAGRVGTGFDGATLKHVLNRLTPLHTDAPPLAKPPTGAQAQGVHWVRPQLLAEVAYAQMTRDGLVRHAVFHGLREDKPARHIDLERPVPSPKRTPAGRSDTLRLTHPDRVVDAKSGATKQAVAEYYAQVWEWLAPHLDHRPVALVRAPEGLAGELFFQKHAGQLNLPHARTFDKREAGQAAMALDRLDSVLGAVQMNMLELHTWNATDRDFDRPDRFVLDLDPDPALPWKAMVEATQLTLALLDELGLQAFLKTSGGKGIHIVVPLTRRASWEEVKGFTERMVEHLADVFPDRLTAVSGPKNRVGRIFVDYLRNSHGATTVCAYSLRAREGLPVSVPIRLEELTTLKSANQWTYANLHERLAELNADPWDGFKKVRQSITAAMRKQLGLAP